MYEVICSDAHSSTRSGCQAPSPQSSQADGHSRHRTRNPNQKDACYSGGPGCGGRGNRVPASFRSQRNLPEELSAGAKRWGLLEAPWTSHVKPGSDRVGTSSADPQGLWISPVGTDFSPNTVLRDLTPRKNVNCEKRWNVWLIWAFPQNLVFVVSLNRRENLNSRHFLRNNINTKGMWLLFF